MILPNRYFVRRTVLSVLAYHPIDL